MTKYTITKEDETFIEDDYHDMHDLGEYWQARAFIGLLTIVVIGVWVYAWLIGAI